MTQGEVRFDGRAVLVTGAGRGLGRTHALLLAARGAKVVVADNGVAMDGEDPDRGPAQAVVAEIEAAGGVAVACTADLATEAGAAQAVQTSLDAFGRIDGIIHNASTVPDLTPADRLSSHDIDVVMRVNAYAGMWLARAAWPHMMARKFGRILYTTSVGIYGQAGTTPYCAAKAAMIGIMRSLAAEGAEHGILLNVIAPSARTRMTERFLSSAYGQWLFDTMPPEKVSVAAAYLVSEACSITGEIFALGGGRIARMTLGEGEGVITPGTSIEQVQEAMPRVLADAKFFHPKDVAERSAKVAALFGFKG